MINKKEFLDNFSDKEMAVKVYDKLNEAVTYSYTTYTDIFVTPNIWKKLPDSYYDIKIKKIGFDRKKIIFIANDFEELDIVNVSIKVNNKFKNMEHKDFLGSIMGLNIRREYLSDLFVKDNTCYFQTSKNIYTILLKELKQIGKNSCEIKEIEKIELDYSFDDISITSSSLRIDSIVKNICNISREKAIELINSSYVYLDYEIIKNKSKELKIADILTIRKYGKYIIEKVEITKKNRYKVFLKKYK